ncbi:hypothetical protein DHEL01_v206022 [Diaporthe helianthi]|uniref:Uncharacterized protein n=1 Tax=Diaporthe helianthi TaxID=158607 RepID=A0A2P5HZA9_DIAHE|nr:hypothetical protein DHEL01_v206022 [Diaporthe helianthi]
MNFSTLRDIYLEESLRILGYGDPDRHPGDLPLISNQYALDLFNKLPEVGCITALQSRQERARTSNEAETTLKAVCCCAGRPLVEAFMVIAGLKRLITRAGRPDATFTNHQYLIKCLVQVRESLAYWEESIGAAAFDSKHARSRDVRYEYLGHTFQLVYVIADVSFPESLREYTEAMSDILKEGDLQQQFVLDSEVTYARSKERTRAGLISPHHQFPKQFVPHGLQTLTPPHFYYNPDLYGHLQVANEACIKQRNDPPEVFLNPGRLNTWDMV